MCYVLFTVNFTLYIIFFHHVNAASHHNIFAVVF